MTAGDNPLFLVRIGTLNLTSAVEPHQMSFEFREKDGGAKKLTLTVHNADMSLIDHPEILEGKEVSFRFGYPDALSPFFTAVLREIKPTFDPGSLNLELGAYDAVADMLSGQSQTVWRQEDGEETKITESDVVLQIAAKNGFTADVEPTKNYYSELAQNEPDFAFLQSLAKTAKPADPSKDVGPYRVVVDSENKRVIFKPVNLNTPVKRSYRWFTESQNPVLLSFSVETATYDPEDNGRTSTEVAGVGPSGDTEATADNESSNRVSQGTKVVIDKVKNAVKVVVGEVLADAGIDDPLHTPDHASAVAENNHNEKELGAVQADISVLGDPELRRGDIIEVLGVGRRYSGQYLCADVVHIIDDGGYHTDIDLKRNALNDVGEGEGAPDAGGRPPDGSDDSREDPDKVIVIDKVKNEVIIPEDEGVTR